MRKLQQIRELFNVLEEKYTVSEIDFIFYSLAEKYLKQNRSTLRAGLHEPSSEVAEKEILFRNALFALLKGEPYQYVIGHTSFFGLELNVNKNVLIPRPETEELVEWMLEDIPDKEKFNGSILDVGTGSGAIAIALKSKLPAANVYAIDVDEKALEVAKINAHKYNVNINFSVLDLFKTDFSDFPYFDYIVSNPPYIPESEKAHMDISVTEFEPEKALFVEDKDPMKFYFEISQKAQDILRFDGRIYLELHQDFGENVQKMYDYAFSKTELKKDISGNWRMLRATGRYTCG